MKSYYFSFKDMEPVDLFGTVDAKTKKDAVRLIKGVLPKEMRQKLVMEDQGREIR